MSHSLHILPTLPIISPKQVAQLWLVHLPYGSNYFINRSNSSYSEDNRPMKVSSDHHAIKDDVPRKRRFDLRVNGDIGLQLLVSHCSALHRLPEKGAAWVTSSSLFLLSTNSCSSPAHHLVSVKGTPLRHPLSQAVQISSMLIHDYRIIIITLY